MIEILYQDDELVVVNKPAPLLLHPYDHKSRKEPTLLKIVRDQIGHYLYPIHRLDKQVSGAVLFAINPKVVKKLQSYWHTDGVRKLYTGLVNANLQDSGVFKFELNDHNKVKRPAKTIYHPIAQFNQYTLCEIEIFTGRYHQIRRHFSRRCMHLLGDRKYGKKRINDPFQAQYGLNRIFLHSHKLIFDHPTDFRRISIDAPLQSDLKSIIKKLYEE